MNDSAQSKVWRLRHDDDPQVVDFCGGSLTIFSRASPDKATANEDAAALVELSPQHGILVVADGMGGANAGDRAAQCVVETIVDLLAAADDVQQSCRSAILDAIETANRTVLNWSIGSGSTVAVVEYFRGSLRAYHVGDTTAMVFSNRGTVKFSTIPHSPVAMAVESGLIDEAEALNHEDRHLISNHVGSPEMKIDLGPPLKMAPRDTLVIASDGLFDNLTTEEIVAQVRAGDLLQNSDALIKSARLRMSRPAELPCKPDDLTVICFRQGRSAR